MKRTIVDRVWLDYMRRRITEKEGMRRLGLTNRNTFQWRMNYISRRRVPLLLDRINHPTSNQ